MHQSSIDKMKLFKKKYLSDKEDQHLTIVDFGSQDIGGCYKPIFENPNWEYCGVDIEAGKNVDLVLRNPYEWNEIKSDSVDVIISGQTLEHVEYFWITIMEIARVLKPEGMCCLIAPSSGYEHRYPVDCWRFYTDGMKAIAEFAKLEMLETYTQWLDESYTDGSNVWHDSVLIAKKPKENEKPRIQSQNFDDRCKEILTETGQIELYKYQLKQAQIDFEVLQNQFYQSEYYKQEFERSIKIMKNSRFWRLRNIFVRFRSLILK